MDIRNWSQSQIMQLPDHMFGRKFLVSCAIEATMDETTYDISELALPEDCVIWEFWMYSYAVASKFIEIGLALGDQLPTSAAMFNALDPLFHGLGVDGPEPRTIPIDNQGSFRFNRIRMPLRAAGRRLVLRISFRKIIRMRQLWDFFLLFQEFPRRYRIA